MMELMQKDWLPMWKGGTKLSPLNVLRVRSYYSTTHWFVTHSQIQYHLDCYSSLNLISLASTSLYIYFHVFSPYAYWLRKLFPINLILSAVQASGNCICDCQINLHISSTKVLRVTFGSSTCIVSNSKNLIKIMQCHPTIGVGKVHITMIRKQ